jgi:hypothetical protein
MRHRLLSSEALPLGGLLAVTIGVFWKIALTDQFTWMDGSDTAFQVLPWLQEQVRQWRTGHFPLWEAHHWAGQSLIGLMQPGVAYPLNWLLALFPLEDHHIRIPVLNWYFIAIHYMGVAFCYALCRDLKASRAAAMLASISFGLCGYLGTNVWPQMMNGVVWAPLIFLFLFRSLRGGRMWFHAAAAGACAGMALLSGHHQAPCFLVLAVGVTLLFLAFSGRASWVRVLASGLTFAGFTLAVAAVQILPSREYYQHAFRWVGSRDPVMFGQKVPYIAHMVLSFHPVSLFGIVVPGVEANITPFLGITIFSLAIIAVLEGWERLEVRLFALLSVFGILLCLGQWSILQGLIYSLVPGMDKARNASFAILVFQFATAVLACFGLDILLAGGMAKVAWRNVGVAALGFGCFLYLVLIARFVFEPARGPNETGVALAALDAVLLGGLFLLWFKGRLSRGAMTWSLVGLTVFEIGNVTGSSYRHREQGWNNLNRLYADRDVVGFLRDHLGDGRFDVNTADMPVNLGDWDDLDQFNGYTGITTNIVGIAFDANSRRLFGVRYYVSNKPRVAGQTPVFQGASGLNVFAELESFPRAWSVKRLEEVSDERLFPGKLASSSPDELRSTGFLAGGKPALDVCDGEDAILFQKIRATSYGLDVEMKCKRMVIVGNDYFPGWIVRIDGEKTVMYEVDRALQGFVVPGGKHRVEVAYRPRPVYVGAGISIAGLLGVAVLGFWR